MANGSTDIFDILHTTRAMRVDHRCTDVLVPQDLLHRSKVVKLCLNRRIARRRVQALSL